MQFFKFFYWWITGLLVILFVAGYGDGSLFSSGLAASTPVPTTNWQGAPLPDWNKISFSKLLGIGSGGAFNAPADVQNQLGYDPSRSWQPGDTPDRYLKLGDVESFEMQQLSAIEIASFPGLDLNNVSLKDFKPFESQTIESLVKAIPDLAELAIEQVQPILDALQAQVQDFINPGQKIGEFLKNSPNLGKIGFENLDLSKYGFRDVPGLEKVPLAELKDWQNFSISGVPGLSDVPFSEFKGVPQPVGASVGIVDVVFGPAEQNRDRTVTGSDQVGYSVPCEKECAHVELAGKGDVLGRQWVSGKFQEVKGGFGILGSVNNGVEPVGRNPFGDAFKVVVWDVSETEGRADSALFFRICKRGLPDLGCTPYFIGPVPWLGYREGGNDVMFIGALDTSTGSSGASTPTGATSNPRNTFGMSKAQIEKLAPKVAAASAVGRGDCSVAAGGVKLDALSQALSAIEGNYDSVGAYTCSGGQCGRALGALQFMSYRDDVAGAIAAKPGGQEFLAKANAPNGGVSGVEVLEFFPPQEQEALFRRDAGNLVAMASNQVDPTTGMNFSGDRLVERVAQMHFGGPGVGIDSGASDVHGRLSVSAYGQEAASYYRSAVQQMGCP